MAVILQTRCFQMDNCEPDLSFSKYVELDCFRRLYIYGHICDFFPGMLNSSSIFFYKVNSLGIGTNWRQQDPGNRTIKTSGTLWTDEYLQVVMTSQNVVLQELQILLKEGGGGGGLKLILAIYTLSIFCEIPIRWIQHITGH